MNKINKKLLKTMLMSIIIPLILFSCGENKQKTIPEIVGFKQFEKIVDSAKDNLIVLDLYAPWCGPCRQLSPILEKLAKSDLPKVKFYKINVDHNQDIANMMKANSIPLVVFMKNGKVVFSVPGLRPEKMYLEMIKKYSI